MMKVASLRLAVALALLCSAASAQHEPLLAATFPAQDSVGFLQAEGPRFALKKSVAVGKSPARMCVDAAGKTLG